MQFGPQVIINTGVTYKDLTKQELGLVLIIPSSLSLAIGSIIATCFIDKLGRRYIMLRTLPAACFFLVVMSISMY